jgi:UDP-N-acetylglucosamine--N-acetylmuramyl-(pentapeptide) pyrophosphoryl-undecaprenol N-acetylglucosamine transferase
VQVCGVTGPDKTAGETPVGRDAGGAAVPAIFLPFCDDMAALLSAADLVVSRAGAGTLAELARCETPAILVPYPQAADNHQQANAQYFAQQGGGLVLEQGRLDQLGPLVRGLLTDPGRLARFRTGLRQMDRPGTLDLIVRDLGSLSTRTARPVPMPAAPA